MSDATVVELNQTIAELRLAKEQLFREKDQLQKAVDSLAPQLDASKQMFNESLNSSFSLRAQNITLDRDLKLESAKLVAANNEITRLTAENASLQEALKTLKAVSESGQVIDAVAEVPQSDAA
jgi:chromosome segregation ATPase